MRLAYFGTAPFAVPALKALAPHVVHVVSQPDRPTGRGLKLTPSPVKQTAIELGIPVSMPEKARSPEFIEFLRTLDCDCFVVAAYGQILPQSILDIPTRGCINLHGSILPAWRGAAPIQRAVESGDKESGVTLMQMDKGMDTGDIIAIERTPIHPDETAGELYDRLSHISATLAKEWIDKIVRGDYPRIPQDNDLASHAAKLTKEDRRLEFSKDAQAVYNQFRAVTPSPGAFIETKFGPLKILKAEFVQNMHGTPAEILAVKPELCVSFQNGALNLIEVQPAGKKRISGFDFANGARINTGDCFI